jgi:FKBP-type peptidyl-prolyl cis-trans isomerase SlyD
MNVNEEKNIELAPADAYGERNPQLVRIMPAAEFKKRDIDPMPGMRINLDGIAATVKTVNSGRVVIDANHPLAGEKLRCRIKIVAKVDSDKDKISALSEMLNLSPKSVEVNDGSAKIVFDEKTKKDADFMVSKSALVDAVFKYLDKINHVSVDELYSKEAEKQPEKETEKQ